MEENILKAESKFASRKFLIAIALLLGQTALYALGDLGETTYANLVIWITGLYFGANAITWFSPKP